MNSDANLSFGITLPYMQRCDLPDCQKATKRVYRVNIEEKGLSFCSNDHARVGLTRWEEKKKMGIKPGSPRATEENPDMVGDNIGEIGGEQ